MNESKLKKLFAAARKDLAPVPPANFADDVLRAVRREPAPAIRPALSIFDQLNQLFPRFALAAAAVILLCIAADYGFTSAGLPDLDDGATQLAAQFDMSVE